MQKKLQQYQNPLLKKEVTKLSLEIKLSLINSTFYYDKQQTKSLRHSTSQTAKDFTNPNDCHPTHDHTEPHSLPHSHSTPRPQSATIDRIDKLEHQLSIQFTMLSQLRNLLTQRLQTLHQSQTTRQKHMKQLTMRRRLLLEGLKRQVTLMIRCGVQQREEFFGRLEAEFDRQVEEFFRKWKRVRKQWKIKLKRIVGMVEGEKNGLGKGVGEEKGLNGQTAESLSLKHLQEQLKQHLVESSSHSIHFQQQLHTLLQTFHKKRQQAKVRHKNSFHQALNAIHQLQKSIKAEIHKEELQSEENREKLLMLFEENVDRIGQTKKQTDGDSDKLRNIENGKWARCLVGDC